MKVNLLPSSARQPRGLRQRIHPAYLIAMVVVIAGGLLYSYLDTELRERSDIVADLRQTQTSLASVQAKRSALDDARKRLGELEASRSYLVAPMETSAFLLELTRLVPQDVTLREMTLTDDGSISIRGEGKSFSSAARLLSQLAQSQYLSNPRLQEIASLSASGYSFTLTCRLTKGGGGA